MHKPSTKTKKLTAALATPVAVLLAGGMVWQASYAAFSGQTRNSGNEWSTGSVALTDDDNGSARFVADNMVPGATETKCITVKATASVPGTVKGYAVNAKIDNEGLAQAVKFTVRSGTGGSFASCDGFAAENTLMQDTTLKNLAAVNSYNGGVGDWAVVAGTQTRTYEITWEFDTTGLTQTQIDNMQGDLVGLDFQWELQSNPNPS
ncbi:hypothetical protein [Janibacter limosus]|uniref:hypothetical protein n=1 Tax=Janibacter limosus TaxID=53458 RepID=UPI000833777A|nr:hypothetical protein [Janibacter limosus]